MTRIVDRATKADSATARMTAARRSRERLIFERNLLVAALSRLWPSHLSPATAKRQSPGWRYVVCIHSPAGQLAWHVTDDEAGTLYAHLAKQPSDWDGHTSAEKLIRLCELAQGVRS